MSREPDESAIQKVLEQCVHLSSPEAISRPEIFIMPEKKLEVELFDLVPSKSGRLHFQLSPSVSYTSLIESLIQTRISR